MLHNQLSRDTVRVRFSDRIQDKDDNTSYLTSPVRQEIWRKQEENKRLKNLLEIVFKENEVLLNDNDSIKEENKTLKLALSDKIKRNRELLQDLNSCIAPSSPVVLEKETKELFSNELKEVREENDFLFSQVTQLQKKIKNLEKEISQQEEDNLILYRKMEHTYEQLKTSIQENEELKTKVKDLLEESELRAAAPINNHELSGIRDEKSLAETMPQLIEITKKTKRKKTTMKKVKNFFKKPIKIQKRITDLRFGLRCFPSMYTGSE